MTDTWTLFDRLADSYDQVIPFFSEFATQTLDVIGLSPGRQLLDVGSGRGAIAAAAVARGYAVTAVDAAPRMVSHLAAAHPEIDVRLMDIHHLDLPDDSYDLATAGFVIHLVKNPTQVLAELRRVLRTAATIALTTPGPCEDHGRWDTFNEIWNEFAPRAAARPFPNHADISLSLHQAGFTDLRTVDIAVHLPVPDPQTCWDFHMSHGFAARLEALNPADAADFRRRSLAELTRMHQSSGIILDRGATIHLATNPT